jgi:hypothetical protein
MSLWVTTPAKDTPSFKKRLSMDRASVRMILSRRLGGGERPVVFSFWGRELEGKRGKVVPPFWGGRELEARNGKGKGYMKEGGC